MNELEDLMNRKVKLKKDLKEVETQLDKLGGDAYKQFAKEYGEKLGKVPSYISRRVFKSPQQKRRVKIVSYLLENKITSDNPITIAQLRMGTGVNSILIGRALEDRFELAPTSVGVVSVVNIPSGYRGILASSKVYLQDISKAKIYLSMMNNLKKLP